MKPTKKVTALNELATEIVGDGKSPNIFFVTQAGNVRTVTQDFAAAYSDWLRLTREHPEQESALEDRKTGTIASREPVEEGSAKLCTIDDTVQFKYRKNWQYSYSDLTAY